MRVDQMEVSWDTAKSKWLVRMVMGEEVIRRHSDLPQNADEQTLRSTAQKMAKDEGYDVDTASVTIRR
jgi:hypothetical protein